MRDNKQRKCPICASDKTEPVVRKTDGTTLITCRSCGQRFNVPTEE